MNWCAKISTCGDILKFQIRKHIFRISASQSAQSAGNLVRSKIYRNKYTFSAFRRPFDALDAFLGSLRVILVVFAITPLVLLQTEYFRTIILGMQVQELTFIKPKMVLFEIKLGMYISMNRSLGFNKKKLTIMSIFQLTLVLFRLFSPKNRIPLQK